MLTKKTLFLILLLIQLMPPAVCDTQSPEDLNAKLRANVNNYQLQARNFVEALTQVASEFRVPMGIEWVNAPGAGASFALSWKNATVREVLQTIVRTQPGFEIVVRGGVVHVLSPDFVPDRENPLKLNINVFEVHNVPAEMASRQLHETVKRTLLPRQPQQGFERRGGVGGSGFSNSDDPKISVTLKNATVEDVLDALALASTRKIWIVTFSDAHTLTDAGYRRTLGLWSTSTVPDDEQPVWDLLHWGDTIPVAALGATKPNS